MNWEERERKYSLSIFIQYLDMQDVDPEENPNKISQNSRPAS